MRRVGFVLVLLAVLVLCAVPAQAAGLTLEGADVGLARWQSFTHDAQATTLNASLQITKPMANAPECPTSLDELWPWAWSNVRLAVPVGGTMTDPGLPLGLGVSERLTFAHVGSVTGRIGVGYLTGLGPSWFVEGGFLNLTF